MLLTLYQVLLLVLVAKVSFDGQYVPANDTHVDMIAIAVSIKVR
jgi:hypothetical protein